MDTTWEKHRQRLKVEFIQKGITKCAIKLDGCFGSSFLSFAHRHKRIWYKSQPELLGDFNQVVLACVMCHGKIEKSSELTQQVFERLRPMYKEKEDERTKKADWSKNHECVNCKMMTSCLICHHCRKLSTNEELPDDTKTSKRKRRRLAKQKGLSGSDVQRDT